MTRWKRTLGVLAFGVLAVAGAVAQGGPGPVHKVLILQSYNERYSWVSSISRGLQRGLEGPWDLWYEYLDAKNLDPGFDFSTYDELFRQKYGQKKFDAVVTVDDPAYQYVARTRDTLFRGAKLVAIGLNGPPQPRLPDASYIIENPEFGRTLNLALRQHPRAGVIHVVLDRSLTGLLVRKQIEAATLERPVTFDWIDSGSAREVEARTSALAPGDILVYGVYFNPTDGYESNDVTLARIRSRVSIPIYAFWSFYMGNGALGGYVYDGTQMGLKGAALVQSRVLDNGPPTYTDETLSTWIFDWNQLKTFGLSPQEFPEDSRFLNKPDDLWRVDPTTVVAVAVAFLVLLAFSVLILVNLRSQRALVASGQLMIATQRELMHNLGNVIENRSNETASHVERITVLALRLADLKGLSPTLRERLEVCAPMHDIGKVGIPDEILKKPGQLTPEEYEVMKTHTVIGYSIFRSSDNPMIQAAARIALEHHEHWNGQGYPTGKAGGAIDQLARMVSVVDVFDALLSERTYKKAWEPERVRLFMARESGKMFDPELAGLLLDHWDEFLALRDAVETRA